MGSPRWSLLLVYLSCLIYLEQIRSETEVLGRKDIPTVTIISTYTELETTSVMLTASSEARPTLTAASEARPTLTEGPEDNDEPENADEKENDVARNNDKQIIDPPSQPLTTPTFPLAASTSLTQMSISSRSPPASTYRPTVNLSPTSRPSVTQSTSQPPRKGSSSQKLFATAKPTPQPGHRSIGATNHIHIGCLLLVAFVALNL
ncbi:hypothetical protein K493DRAFT_300076 [Basidiobolus meristosporus CBS 931.73]|uniref:Uncharacterized protein n=1 Tax=Basidiobolus meristosporus CBS 931.73 TaxID=1314790 RepID=A0A1Y1YKN2_9FUNG|nr:hypothetical protein K493DRAFT_300076 [Basidiobolus meristosporus CBS 931.73]|eukprot:ORX98154.1 hypothetical protein K493DRAFT_300076 [Basidiobolus meristosporus CBS 931.73]